MKKTLTTIFLAAALATSAQVPYRVISPFAGVADGTVAYLVNFDDGTPVDSAIVNEGAAVFTGEIDEPIAVRIYANDKRMGTLILEQGTTAVNQQSRRASGTMLNDQLNALSDQVESIGKDLNQDSSEEEVQKAYDEYLATLRDYAIKNSDSPIGYLMFLDYAYAVDASTMMDFLEANPEYKQYKRVQSLVTSAERKLATSAGKPFVDFEVAYDGTTKKLSDYVGNGKYTLVDFWASWCGPCIKEIKTLKEIYAEYKDKGLQVLGVAVWDQPADTEAAIKRLQIPWECIINSQNIATDAYGIPAIPCIILFAPDGTIVFRDLQGEQLKAAVAKALE